MNSSNTITTQPVFSHQDKLDKQPNNDINSHKNSCEKCVSCDSNKQNCPTTCQEFGDHFKLGDDNSYNGNRNFGFYSCCCFPVTLPVNTLICGPCTVYNICRNKCDNNEKSKNYLC